MPLAESVARASACKRRIVETLAHRQPDRVPIDFGGTAVTGVHVSCVAALRDYFGLPKCPVAVHEPFQMLGRLEEDLKQAMGIDVEGVFPRNTMFGFPNRTGSLGISMAWRCWSRRSSTLRWSRRRHPDLSRRAI